jgi:hypothetical protein
MSTTAAKVAPKTFTQTKNVVQAFVTWTGGWIGYQERSHNDQLWWDHHRSRWAKNAIAEEEAKKQADMKAGKVNKIPEIIPEELHGLYKEVTGTA